jgi:hypothetical protein
MNIERATYLVPTNARASDGYNCRGLIPHVGPLSEMMITTRRALHHANV